MLRPGEKAPPLKRRATARVRSSRDILRLAGDLLESDTLPMNPGWRDNCPYESNDYNFQGTIFRGIQICAKSGPPGRSCRARRTGSGSRPGTGDDRTLDSVPLARRITEHAYKAGASLVTTLFTDEESALLRFRYGADAGFDTAAAWLYEGMAQAFRSGAARLAITGNNPSLLSKEDPEKVSRANRSMSKAYRPALELITRHEINWTIVACATPAWAAAVFPDLPPGSGDGAAVGRDLRSVARRSGRSGGGMENA